jgi:glucose-6-phosphate isomerase
MSGYCKSRVIRRKNDEDLSMKEIMTSGLPIFIHEDTFKLDFRDSLTCAGSSGKYAGQLKDLLYAEAGIDEYEYCYEAYRDIAFEQDRTQFQKLDFRYDITVIMPGTVQGECKKTSGHYHGYIDHQPFTYPEVYEVLMGKAVYILQKVNNFDKENEVPIIEDLKAVFVEENQVIIVPPFYGHCSINVGDGPMVFSNIAVVSCPLHYEPIKRRHGLSVYVLKDRGKVSFVSNLNYQSVPEVKFISPKDNPALGITFGEPVYDTFIEKPEKFDFLLNPGRYISAMADMLNQVKN